MGKLRKVSRDWSTLGVFELDEDIMRQLGFILCDGWLKELLVFWSRFPEVPSRLNKQ